MTATATKPRKQRLPAKMPTVEEPEEAGLHTQLASLTPREREVYAMYMAGWLNKETAAWLGISQKTLDVHRANLLRKFRMKNVHSLVATVYCQLLDRIAEAVESGNKQEISSSVREALAVLAVSKE